MMMIRMRDFVAGIIMMAVGFVCIGATLWLLATGQSPPVQTPEFYCVCTCDGESVTLEIETGDGDDGESNLPAAKVDESL